MANDNTTVKQTADEALATERTRSGCCYRPNVDIIEKGEELLVLADIPGAAGDKIDVNFEDGALSIHAEVPPRQDNETEFLLREYNLGDYYRTFKISEAIDASKITADYADGVLTLRLPKADAVKPRKISVSTR